MFNHGTVLGKAAPALIKSFSDARASGALIFKVSDSIEKKVNFWHGNIISASSNLIDDRMGEVMYRYGRLSLDDFLATAGKVTQKIRFGDALLRSGLFTPLDLWNALNEQSLEIIISLCFYPGFDVKFEESSTIQKNELAIQFNIHDLLNTALEEAQLIEMFVNTIRTNPLLELENGWEKLATNNFLQDMAGLVAKSKNFNDVIETESRLSPVYTTRALYSLYCRGILKDTAGFTHSVIQEGNERLFSEIVEDANFMFVEIANAVHLEGIEDWPAIIELSNQSLISILGSGIYINVENGFIFDAILRSCIVNSGIRSLALKYNTSTKWLNAPFDALKDSLYSIILQIFFELYNRKFNSPEFLRVKNLIDKMKFPTV